MTADWRVRVPSPQTQIPQLLVLRILRGWVWGALSIELFFWFLFRGSMDPGPDLHSLPLTWVQALKR